MHKEVYGYTPASFAQRKLTRDEGSVLEKAFWKMIFATKIIKEVDVFLTIYFVMVTNLKYYFKDSEEFRKEFRVMIEGHPEQDLYKNFSIISLNLTKRIFYNKESNGG